MPINEPATDIESDVFLDDRKLAEIAFPGAIPICLDSFMYRSREQYPLPWLTREIAQNYVLIKLKLRENIEIVLFVIISSHKNLLNLNTEILNVVL